MKLQCPKCKHEWDYKGKAKRVKCWNCKFYGVIKNFTKTSLGPSELHSKTSPYANTVDEAIAESIITGDIIKAVTKLGLDPRKRGGDHIPYILQDRFLEVALGRASRKERKSPEKIIKMALRRWLKEEKYI